MRITRNTSLFFDASVLVAGAHSPGGGSALLLEACKAGGFQAQTTFLIFLEALHALSGFPQATLRRFDQLLAKINWVLCTIPPKQTLEQYRQYTDPGDIHVLASAIEGRAEFLLTLDRRHILSASEPLARAGVPIIILRPGDFIHQYYPQHEAYRNLPSARVHAGKE